MMAQSNGQNGVKGFNGTYHWRFTLQFAVAGNKAF